MKLKGYIFSRPFFQERVPQSVQNLVIRDYCRKKKIDILLSATEYAMSESTFILFELTKNYNNYDGIVFYSLLQLPANKEERYKLYKESLDKNKELHFALENLLAKNKKNFSEIEKIFSIKSLDFNKNKIHKRKIQLKNFITPNHTKTKRLPSPKLIDSEGCFIMIVPILTTPTRAWKNLIFFPFNCFNCPHLN